MLLTGIVIGSLATILWQGMRKGDDGVGAGIRQMIEQSKIQDQQGQENSVGSQDDKPAKQETTFDFYTVLPEIEVVVPDIKPETSSIDLQSGNSENAVDKVVVEDSNSAYMLQAGSYKKAADADRLKAKLAFTGLSSMIQKVTIEGKGDFYRVRLGPFNSYAEMAKADENLGQQGIETLRLKISKGG